MAVQASISEQKLSRRVGGIEDIIIDGRDEEGIIARSKGDAPEIDGMVFVNNEHDCKAGDIVRSRITDHNAHDLWSEIIKE
jgi:ribosomal protein S12 methylthiotransferase